VKNKVPIYALAACGSSDRNRAASPSGLTLDDLSTRLQGIFSTRRDKTMFIVGAPTLRYADFVP